MSRPAFWNAVSFCIAASSLAFPASAAPPEVFNKTVTLSFDHHTPAMCDNGRPNRATRHVAQQIYVSTKGRLFAKTAVGAGRALRQKEFAPSVSSKFRLSGDRIVGTFPEASGATQVTVTFDSSYRSCNAEVVTGLEPGKPFVWIGVTGVRCTGTGKAVISNVSCSVSEGNPFVD